MELRDDSVGTRRRDSRARDGPADTGPVSHTVSVIEQLYTWK